MGLGVIGIDGERVLVTGGGVVRPPQVVERVTQVVVDFSEIRIDGKRLVIAGDGIFQPPQVFERVA